MIAQAVRVERLVDSERQRLLEENTHLREELKRALRLLAHRRHERADAAGVRADRPCGPGEHDRADSRGVGDGQGAHRARDSLQLAAREEAVREGQLRGAA